MDEVAALLHKLRIVELARQQAGSDTYLLTY